jgi:SHS2 domain-containing protein
MKNKNIQFHEDIAIADTAFTVRGKSIEELFKNAAIALISVMADISRIKPKIKKTFSKNASQLDLLLFDFLNEILFYKDTENLLFSQFSVAISKKGTVYHLKATLKGEGADSKKHSITIDIKAITMHMFKLEKTKGGYEARVVVDI